MKRTNQMWNIATVILPVGLLLTLVLFSGSLVASAAVAAGEEEISMTLRDTHEHESGKTFSERNKILENAAKLHVPFVENEGQAEAEAVRFYARTFGGTVFVSDGGVLTYNLPAGNGTGVVIREFVSEKAGITSVGIDHSPTKVSYFIGNDPDKWRSNLTTYNAVSLGEVYTGITLSLKAYGDNMEKIFTVEPGAKSEAIRVQVKGADSLSVSESGELELETTAGVMRFTKPVAYQEGDGGGREEVEVEYRIDNQRTYGFSVGDYDTTHPLIVDPLLASTFVGGSSSDYANAIIIDGTGNVFVAGTTCSTDYPTTAGAFTTIRNGSDDVFVSKLNSDLSSLTASTFIGGSSSDYANAIIIDGTGNVFVAGTTYSTDYPTTAGAYDSSYNGHYDVFVSKLNSDLSSLTASTFIGGSNGDYANAITTDDTDNVFVAGYTYSTNYPTTTGAYDSSYNSHYDVFVSKLNSDLSSLTASTFIGGSNGDYANAITTDDTNNVFVAGRTGSTDYPTTAGAYDSSHDGGGWYDVFVSKLNSDLSSLTASTFIGGDNGDHANAITTDGTDDVFVAGYTYSTNYPTTTGAYDESRNGSVDVFVSNLNSDLSSLTASTFIGGSSWDEAHAITIGRADNIFVAGRTGSTDYPTTAGAYDESPNGGSDVFVSQLSSDLSSLTASTFIGGNSTDWVNAITTDGTDNIFVAGYTYSPNYPTTVDAYDPNHDGGYDVFVSKLDIVDIPQKGDLNGDGNITPVDAAITLLLTVSGGWDENADISGDNRITSIDALMILQAAAGAITL